MPLFFRLVLFADHQLLVEASTHACQNSSIQTITCAGGGGADGVCAHEPMGEDAPGEPGWEYLPLWGVLYSIWSLSGCFRMFLHTLYSWTPRHTHPTATLLPRND